MSAIKTSPAACWIWLPDWNREDDADARIVYFRKTFSLESLPASFPIGITADSRYKLYVNGTFVQEGPAKGDLEQWFLDQAELAPYLKTRENVIACEVLRYPHPASLRNHSLYRSDTPCLYLEGSIATDKSWKCTRAGHISIVGETGFPAPIHIMENAKGNASFQGWKESEFDDAAWDNARPWSDFEISLADAPFHLVPRDIPPMRHSDRCFEGLVCVRENQSTGPKETPDQSDAELIAAWNAMLHTTLEPRDDHSSVDIPPYTRQIVELTSGVLQCGYPSISIAGGRDARFTFMPAESYVYPVPADETVMEGIPPQPKKGDRTDHVRGILDGQKDAYQAGGFGTEESPEIYEPFWFRTFRFLRIEIETQEEPLSIQRLFYRATGYPFDLKTKVQSSDPSFSGIWDISLRTLKRCMHETYMDCPYYEQLQYTMDSRSEILYTYCTTGDDRLARRCMDDFRRSQRSDGLLSASAPTIKTNVIPGFSIYYILMLHDHMMYFGDRDLVLDHFPAVEQILRFFERNLDNRGLVKHIGGPLIQSRYWSFIDWTPEWGATIGVPSACQKESRALTMESLLYLYGLQKTVDLADYIGRKEQASSYRAAAEILKKAINSHCMGSCEVDGDGLCFLQDGPGVQDYSVHCQVFGVLTGVLSPEKSRSVLERAIGNPQFAQASVSFMFYLFRALETVGWYEKADDLWDIWRKMLSDHLSTCVENTTDSRSDCHAWASVLLYELPSVYLGVRPAAPGYRKIKIRPNPGHLTSASGEMVTPRGMVRVSWKKNQEGEMDLTYTIPEGVEIL